MSLLQFVHTSQQDMHIHQWLHHLADRVSGAVSRHEGYAARRTALVAVLRELSVPDCHLRYLGSCALAKLGQCGEDVRLPLARTDEAVRPSIDRAMAAAGVA